MQSIYQQQKKQKAQSRFAHLLLFLLFVVLIVVANDGQLNPFARYSYDFKLSQLGMQTKASSPTRIVILRLSKQQINQPQYMAKLLDALVQKGASLVALDMLLTESSKTALIELANGKFISEQQLFASKLAQHDGILGFYFLPHKPLQLGQLVMNYSFLTDKPQKPLNLPSQVGYITSAEPLQLAAQGTGFVNLHPDDDGILRKATLLKTYQGRLFPAFSLALSMTYLVRSQVQLGTRSQGKNTYIEQIQLLQKPILTNHQAQVFIPFSANTSSLYPVIDTRILNTPKEQVLAGSIVLLSQVQTDKRHFHTPTAQTLSSAQVHATLIDGLLHGVFVHQPKLERLIKTLGLLGFGLLFAFWLVRFNLWQILAVNLMSLLLLYVLEFVLFMQSVQVDMSLLMLYVLFVSLMQYVLNKLSRKQQYQYYQSLFGQQLPTAQINQLNKLNWQDTQAQYKPLSLLHVRYAPWEAFLATLPADQQQRLQQLFLTELTDELTQHSGTLANYHYDGLSAYWGAPLELTQHTSLALACALGMVKRLPQFLQTQSLHLAHSQQLQIGLHESTFLVGDFGSRQYQSYRIKGEGTAIALKLSQLNQQYGTEILASENIYLACKRYVFRYIDTLHHKQQFIRIYQPVCLRQKQSNALKAELSDYEKAYKAYLKQRWYGAGVAFDKLIEQHPHNKLYAMYRQRIRQLATQNVPPNWRGNYPLDET